MSGRIRRGTLSVNGSPRANVANMQWDDNHEFDRSKGDNEMHGIPVQMSEGGSGSFELLAGNVPSGYGTANMVYTYKEVSVATGVETVTDKTVTFTEVTFVTGGNVPADGKGSRAVKFDYGSVSDPT